MWGGQSGRERARAVATVQETGVSHPNSMSPPSPGFRGLPRASQVCELSLARIISLDIPGPSATTSPARGARTPPLPGQPPGSPRASPDKNTPSPDCVGGPSPTQPCTRRSRPDLPLSAFGHAASSEDRPQGHGEARSGQHHPHPRPPCPQLLGPHVDHLSPSICHHRPPMPAASTETGSSACHRGHQAEPPWGMRFAQTEWRPRFPSSVDGGVSQGFRNLGVREHPIWGSPLQVAEAGASGGQAAAEGLSDCPSVRSMGVLLRPPPCAHTLLLRRPRGLNPLFVDTRCHRRAGAREADAPLEGLQAFPPNSCAQIKRSLTCPWVGDGHRCK